MPRILTPGNHFQKSIDNGFYDFARAASTYADDNCYHATGKCVWKMQKRAIHNSWAEGSDHTCASLGLTNAFRCGDILQENYEGTRLVLTNLDATPGDSGSGAVWGGYIDGVIVEGCYAGCGNGFSLFHTAYDVQNQLGNGYFYFNCHPTEKHSSPGGWGLCPSISRS